MSRIAIAEHALLSDCRSAALVVAGSVDWLCFPRFDSSPVFGRLLDDAAGHFVIRPTDPQALPVVRYRPQSLVLETTWTCADGVLVVLDALALGRHERGHELGHSSPGVLLRGAECVEGSVAISWQYAPRPEFGLVHPRLRAVDGGIVSEGGATVLMLSTDTTFEVRGATVEGATVLNAGDRAAWALQGTTSFGPELPKPWAAKAVHRRLAQAERVWKSWSHLHQRYEGPFRDLVHHSGMVLQALTYAPSGAIIAAATTSLPEGIGSSRTWDYRYTWIRDASMTMRGLWVAACPDEASRFFAFLARASGTELDRGLHLQIMFGVEGEHDLTEHEVAHLSGWRDSAPVRVGNGAWNQVQLDVYGALLDAAYVLRDDLDALDDATRHLLVAAVDTAATRWTDEDQGIWEIRGPARPYLHSKLMCWVALDRGIAIVDLLGATERVSRWTKTRDQIRDVIVEQAWNPRLGAFTQSLGGDELDAAVLHMALVGILPPDDPKLASTVDAIAEQLTDSRGLLRRYRGDDGLEGEEGSFLLCTFWLAEAQAAIGRLDAAEETLALAVDSANDLGLFAEQIDAETGEMLGNYPQAFSHLGLILAAQAIATARKSSQTDPRGQIHARQP